MLNHAPKEVLAAAQDTIALAAGCKPTRNTHPTAESYADRPFTALAYAAGILSRPDLAQRGERAVMAAGFATSEFSKLLASGLQVLASQKYDANAEHRAVAKIVECRDFRTTGATNVDLDLSLSPVGEGGEVRSGTVALASGGSGRLTSYAKLFCFGRPLLVNDDTQSIVETVGGLGAAASRKEAKLLADLLEANQTLGDGEATFHVDHGNIVPSAFSATTMGTAMAALRNMATPAGNKANLTARHLLIAPDLELTARQTLYASGMTDMLNIVVSPDLPAGRWYVFADPGQQAAIGLLQLRGGRPGVRIEQGKPPIDFDGAAVRAGADMGAVMLGRWPVIKGGV